MSQNQETQGTGCTTKKFGRASDPSSGKPPTKACGIGRKTTGKSRKTPCSGPFSPGGKELKQDTNTQRGRD